MKGDKRLHFKHDGRKGKKENDTVGNRAHRLLTDKNNPNPPRNYSDARRQAVYEKYYLEDVIKASSQKLFMARGLSK